MPPTLSSTVHDSPPIAPVEVAARPQRVQTLRGVRRAWRPRITEPNTNVSFSLVDRVLLARGVSGLDAGDFLSPALKQLHEPSLMPGIDRAAGRILDAARSRQPIVIFGDYDVDGITATAILFHTLRLLAPEADVRTYVPHRLDEGYGLSSEALAQLASEGARVVVSVDCGITAREPARIAKEAGLDLIITDHHTPPTHAADLPDAFALVHPRIGPHFGLSDYPFPDLCGAGVAYKLAWRLCTLACGESRVAPPVRDHLIQMLSLAALGAIADVVPLRGENRVMTRFGLGLMKRPTIEGLQRLIEASRLDSDRIDAEDVGFRLAPRLNAAGRMGHAREAVELLTTATGDRAREIAVGLSKLNDERRTTEQRIASEAASRALEAGMATDAGRFIVLADPGWHRGVVGIACSRLVDKFARPTILLQEEGGLCSGSARSIPAYDLHAALEHCGDLLERFGGHAMAAGLCIRADRLPELAARLQSHAAERLRDDDLVTAFEFDTEAGLDELRIDAVETLASLGPFGAGNPRPRLVLRGVRLSQPVKSLGSTGGHVAMHIDDAGGTGPGPARQGPRATAARALRLVGWNFAPHAEGLRSGQRLDVLIEPKVSTFTGRPTVEPEVLDVRPSGS